MNKEEILNAFLLANIPEIITQEEFNDVKKAIKQLLQENKKYKEVIDELKKYLHIRGIKQCYNGKVYCGFDGLQANVFEDILKEVE